MRVVHFGAGAIGLGFIAERLVASGHDVTLVDVDTRLVREIDEAGHFDIFWIDDQMRHEVVGPVRALSLSDVEKVTELLLGADLVTTAVWATNLHTVAPIVADALEARALAGAPRLQLIPCENAVDNGEIFAEAVLAHLGGRDRVWLDEHARFASTVVDRMVRVAPQLEGTAPVQAGRTFELVLDRPGLLHPEASIIVGARVVESLTPFLERKLFVINGGHARGAYLGALRGYTDMQQVYEDQELLAAMRTSMMQTGALVSHDHGFSPEDMEGYVDFALTRWVTSSVPDEISRVGRSPIRKLASQDRLVAPLLRTVALDLPHDALLDGVAAALLYRNPHDDEAVQLGAYIDAHGLDDALEHFTGIRAETDPGRRILAAAERFGYADGHETQE